MSNAGEPDVPTVPTPPALEQVDTAARGFLKVLYDLQEQLIALKGAVADATKSISYVPKQIRTLSNKMDGLATSVSEPRCRALLLDFVRIGDMVDQCLKGPGDESEADPASRHQRNYEILRTQIRQVLVMNGLTEIPTDGPIDFRLHHGMDSVPCDSPENHNQIVSVIRPGFQTEDGTEVLRAADVVVSKYQKPTSEKQDAGPPPGQTEK